MSTAKFKGQIPNSAFFPLIVAQTIMLACILVVTSFIGCLAGVNNARIERFIQGYQTSAKEAEGRRQAARKAFEEAELDRKAKQMLRDEGYDWDNLR